MTKTKHAEILRTSEFIKTKAQRAQPEDYREVYYYVNSNIAQSFYLFQKIQTSVLSFSKIWVLTLYEGWKIGYSEAQQRRETHFSQAGTPLNVTET